MGGAPFRVVRVSEPGAQVLDAWESGAPVGAAEAAAALARNLTDSGIAVPIVGSRPIGAGAGVSIVIPVHDRPDGLLVTLRALRDLTGPGGAMEVLVVDDGSSDDGSVPATIAAAGVGASVLRRPERGGPAAARNTGWRSAKGPTIAFIDADCVPAKGWLDILLPHLDDPSVAAVAPRVPSSAADLPGRPAASWLTRYEAVRSPLDLGATAAPVRPGSHVSYVPSAALVVRRDVLEEAGGFDEAMPVGEDVDLVWRLAAAGWRVRYEPGALVWHPPRSSLGGLLRQRHLYGTSAQPLAARHGSAVTPLVLAWPSALAWAAALGGPPAVAAAAAAGAIGWSAWRLRGVTGLPARGAARLALSGHVSGGRAMAEAIRRAWWPLALAAGVMAPRRVRAPAVVAVAPLLLEWQRAGRPLDPLRWVLLRLADDVAYGSGVWAGCWRGRSGRALLPRIIY